MSRNDNTEPKRRLSVKAAAGIALSAMLALGALAAPAYAGWGDRPGGHQGDNQGGHQDAHRDDDRGRSYGANVYYAPPPVVYVAPYAGTPYYPPPVVYGPAVGVNLPGVSIGIF